MKAQEVQMRTGEGGVASLSSEPRQCRFCLDVCSQARPLPLASGLANWKPSMEKQVRRKLFAYVVTSRVTARMQADLGNSSPNAQPLSGRAERTPSSTSGQAPGPETAH